jgi:hypothetical protein
MGDNLDAETVQDPAPVDQKTLSMKSKPVTKDH